jgi:hypothetical protein
MEPARGIATIWSIVASTASKNSKPRLFRRASYQRPAERYSASASSSKRTRGFTVRAARPQRAGVHHPRLRHPTHSPGLVGLAVRSRQPRPLQHRPGAPWRHRQGWQAVRPLRRRARRGAAPMHRAARLALVTSYGYFTPTSSPTLRCTRHHPLRSRAAAGAGERETLADEFRPLPRFGDDRSALHSSRERE